MSSRSDRDVVVVSALRTPICKARRGAAKEVPPDDLLLAVLEVNFSDARERISEERGDGPASPWTAVEAALQRKFHGLPLGRRLCKKVGHREFGVDYLEHKVYITYSWRVVSAIAARRLVISSGWANP